VLLALTAFVVGLALVVSVLHAYFRDVGPILGAVLLPWFFISPIFFEPEAITQKETARFVLEWVNPVAPFIGAIRDVVYGGVVPQTKELVYVVVAAAIALLAGHALFRRLQGELAVVV
jgi:ABC-type polysaccharide/polyol phosphate export permease